MKKAVIIAGGVVIMFVLVAALVLGIPCFGRIDDAVAARDIAVDSTDALLNYGKIVNLAITDTQTETSEIDDSVTLEAAVGAFAYPQITVEAGKPARINFKVSEGDLNYCNNEIIIPEWSIRKTLLVGDNFVEFTPTKTGTFTYSCWMNMIRGSITVVEQGDGTAGALPANTETGYGMTGGCCGTMGGGY